MINDFEKYMDSFSVLFTHEKNYEKIKEHIL